MNAPIFIPSKGRAGFAKAVTKLLDENLPFFLVVEPKEEAAYRSAYPLAKGILVLEQNNGGIAYVRNFILNYVRSKKFSWYWQLDDDINMMGFVKEKKVLKAPFGFILGQAGDLLSYVPDLAIGALEYQQFAWSATKPYAMNSYCDTCVLVNVERTKTFQYRPDVKEDRDFVLQALSLGYASARTSRFCFGSPKNGSNEGGLHDEYKAGLERTWSENMVGLWPGICSLQTKKDGRPDVKVNWKLFKPGKR